MFAMRQFTGAWALISMTDKPDRKSTRLNSNHGYISYAVFCLKKKSEKNKAEPASNIQNRLRSLRLANGLTQAELPAQAGITRQAVYSIEANQYLPTTAGAVPLADALDRRVEDLFSLVAIGEAIEGDLIGSPPTG